MFLSTLFFLYVATGTTITDLRDVRVYFISFDISRPEVLIHFAWLLLGWYFYRFWLSNAGIRAFQLIKNGHLNEQNFLMSYMLRKIKEQNPNRREMRVEFTTPKRDKSRYYLETNRVLEMQAAKDNWNDAQGISKELDIGATEWYYLVGRHIISVALTKSPNFWDSIFPYYYAIAAMIVGAYRWLIENCI